MLSALVLIGALLASPALVRAHEAAREEEQRLPTLGAAPDFALTSQDGAEVTLESLRGKVVAVTFIYTWCPDVCPMLTDNMARVQDALGPDFGTKVAFVSITIDPERDTPAVLKDYAGHSTPTSRAGASSPAIRARFSTWRIATAWR